MAEFQITTSKTIQGWKFVATGNQAQIIEPGGKSLTLQFSDEKDEVWSRPIGWFWTALSDSEEFTAKQMENSGQTATTAD